MQNLVLLSGGIDSALCLALALQEGPVHAVTFSYSQRNQREISAAQQLVHALILESVSARIDLHLTHEVIPLAPQLFSGNLAKPHAPVQTEEQAVVPFRNGVFLALAASMLGHYPQGQIWIGTCPDPNTPSSVFLDTHIDFIKAFNETLRKGLATNIHVRNPLRGYYKSAVIAEAVRLGVRLDLTWTCYENQWKACGLCPACKKRLEAFDKAGVPDPCNYKKVESSL